MNKKLYLFISFVILLQLTAIASHIKGGWLYYEYLGVSPTDPSMYRYKLVLKVYRDCNPPLPQQNDPIVTFTIFRNDNNASSIVQALNTRIYPLNKQSFDNCITPRPTVCYSVLEYETTIDLPPINAGYTISFQRCCRILNIVNVVPPSDDYGNTYTITIPGTAANINDPRNSSPKFAEKDTAVVCFNSTLALDYSATDADGDSLAYEFAPAIRGGGTMNPNPLFATVPPYQSVPYQPPYTFLSPFNTNIQINPATGMITGNSPAATGEYVLAVKVKEYRNGVFLAETRKELHVVVNACSLSGAQLDPRPTTCDGFTVNFENASSSPSIVKYNWDFGVLTRTDDTSNLPRPGYTYQDTGAYVVKLVVNRGDPCSDSTTQVFRVYPGFYPGFDFTGACKGIPFQFTDTTKATYGMVNSWRWDFGDGTTLADTSHIRNPQYIYPAAGIKNVALIVTSSKGCIDTAIVPVQVLDKPALTLPFHDTLICSIDTLQLHANGTGNFSWTPNYRISNINISNPLVNPLDTTVYTVTLNDRGCIATDSIKVNVLDRITVDAGRDTTICLTDTVVLQPQSHALSYQWSPTATLINPNTKNPFAIPTAASTTYFVTANLGKCRDRDSITISAIPYPQSNAGIDTSICYGGTVTLRGNAVGSTHTWLPASIINNPAALTTNAFPRYTTLFVLSVTDTLGCIKPKNDSVLVTVIPPVQVFAGNDTSVVIGQPLVFQSSASSFATSYNWSPVIGINNPTMLWPTAVITQALFPVGSDRITYTFTATSPEGCTASDNINVKIFKVPPSIFVPDAFTPNGDGKNDIIKPIIVGMQKLEFFRIYNRYGQIVFQTSEIGKGWDGRINGELQASAGFVYSVQAIDYTGKMAKSSGTFILIR